MCSHYQGIKDRESMGKSMRAHGIPILSETDMWPKPAVDCALLSMRAPGAPR